MIRAWIEGDPGGMRMRITRTLDISTREEDSTPAASIDEACESSGAGWRLSTAVTGS